MTLKVTKQPMTLKGTVEKATENLTTTAPHLVCLLVIVGGFLYYLDRKATRDKEAIGLVERVAEERIVECHSIQRESVESMREVALSLHGQADKLNQLMELLRRDMKTRDWRSEDEK